MNADYAVAMIAVWANRHLPLLAPGDALDATMRREGFTGA